MFKKKKLKKKKTGKIECSTIVPRKLCIVVGQNEILIKTFEPSFIRDYDYEGKKQSKLRINLG